VEIDMEIRKAKKEDIEHVKLLLDRNFDEVLSKYHSKAVLDKFKSHNTLENLLSQLNWKTVYVVLEGEEIIATGAFVNFGNIAKPKYSVSNLYVLPELHPKGIGKVLFTKLLQAAKDREANSFHVPSSKNAIAFYEKMGFAIDKKQPEKDDEITWMTMKL